MTEPNKFTQWSGHASDMWQPERSTTKHINPGIYSMRDSFTGPFLSSFAPKYDRAVIVEEGISQKVMEGIKKFIASKDRYKKFGLLHKRGVLLEGPPGTGKTISAMLVAQGVVEMGGLAIIPHPHMLEGMDRLCRFLANLREVQPDMFLNLIWEDIHRFSENQDRLDAFLLLLDGYSQIDNVVHIATTNFVKNLDSRIRNRPGRFDEVHTVLAPTEKARRSYLEQIVPKDELDPKVIDTMVKVSDGLMLAHLKDLVVCSLCQDLPITEVADRLKAMNNQAIEEAMMKEEGSDE